MGFPVVDCVRDESDIMLHKEYGDRNDATDGTISPLADDTSGHTKRPPWTLGIVDTKDEINKVSLTLHMTM